MSSTSTRSDTIVQASSLADELAYASKYRGIGLSRAARARSYAALAIGLV